jgi:hypothetical protein
MQSSSTILTNFLKGDAKTHNPFEKVKYKLIKMFVRSNKNLLEVINICRFEKGNLTLKTKLMNKNLHKQ